LPQVFEELKGESLKPFSAALHNEETRENYYVKLRHFLRFVKMDVDKFVDLAEHNPAQVESLLFDYIDARKKEGVSASTIVMGRDAIKLLLEMNDVPNIN
jgi:hypothetical protein